jgi:hypothetical protein
VLNRVNCKPPDGKRTVGSPAGMPLVNHPAPLNSTFAGFSRCSRGTKQCDHQPSEAGRTDRTGAAGWPNAKTCQEPTSSVQSACSKWAVGNETSYTNTRNQKPPETGTRYPLGYADSVNGVVMRRAAREMIEKAAFIGRLRSRFHLQRNYDRESLFQTTA